MPFSFVGLAQCLDLEQFIRISVIENKQLKLKMGSL
jgi:hypothetical protein